MVCERVVAYVKSLKIEDGINHILTKYKTGNKAIKPDHTPLVMDVLMKVPPTKKVRVEITDFKDLVHVISKKGENMSNIIHRRNNSIGTEKPNIENYKRPWALYI